MPTAPPKRLSRPRLAAMILEATATTVSIVLLLWLLLWFIQRTVPQGNVSAYYAVADGVPPEEIPFQEADIRRLRGTSAADPVHPSGAGEWADAVLARAREGGSTLVAYVSAPTLARDTTAASLPINRLLRDLVREARRDVVLAIDLAQIDSDREVGIFGNAPTARLAEQVRAVLKEQGKPLNSLFILTSAAPGQRSWSAEGLGESIFAHYLRLGLEGAAKGWDAAEPESITAEGLHRYVLRHVRRWAELRRGAEQTPECLPILPDGQKPRTVYLRPIRPADPPSSTIAETPPPATPAKEKPVTVAKTEKEPEPPAAGPPPDPFATLWNDLFSEWKKHDEIRAAGPYRDVPAAWRSYEAALLRAERGLRASRREPVLWTQRAREALTAARETRNRLEQDRKSRARERDQFPFRPIHDDSDGQQLLDALAVLKVGQRPDGIPLPAARSDEAAPAPGKTGTGANAAPASPTIPRAFNVPIDQIRSLELQLPAWAYRFQADFERPGYFADESRSRRLVRLIELRHQAEAALAADRRGLAWIRPLIAIGDRERRTLQDRLFGSSDEVDQADEEARLTRAKSAYDAASAAIDQYQRARGSWERAAAELPYLAEWAVRRSAIPGQGATGLPADLLPETVAVALRELDSLARALAPPSIEDRPGTDEATTTAIEDQTRRLSESASRLRETLQALDDDFKRSTDSYVAGETPGWVELDAALRLPLLESAKRDVLLKNLLAMQETIEDLAGPNDGDKETADADAPDRGFWVRAAGLARIDLTLRRTGQVAPAGEPPEENAALSVIWETIRRRTGSATEPLPLFDPINRIDAGLRGEARARLLASSPANPARTMAVVEKERRSRDAEARLLTAAETDAMLAGPVSPSHDLERLADCAGLTFHLARLRLDNAEDRALRSLAAIVDDLKTTLGIERTPPLAAPAGLVVSVVSSGPVTIRQKDWKTEFRVDLAAAPGTPADRPALPPGQAFVGLAGSAEGLTANDRPLAEVPGGLVRLPVELAARRSLSFTIAQIDNVPLSGLSETVPVVARLFYRGRSNLAEPARVDIRPRKIGDRVAIRILQDPDRLREKYPNINRTIPDQFRNHPGEGFFHKGKELDYIIEVVNQTPRPMIVTGRHFLVDDMTQQEAETFPPVERQPLAPGVPVRIFWGRVRASDAPNGRPHLRIKLADLQAQGELPAFNVLFKEVLLSSYIDITTRHDPNYTFQQNGQPRTEPCFLVKMRRKESDPVTEPIPAGDLGCEFRAANLMPPNVLTGAGQDRPWIWPGNTIEFYQPTTNVTGPIEWKPRIAGESLEWRTAN